MVVQYVEAPNHEVSAMGWPAVFLAGGITGCPDWQQDAVELLRKTGIDVMALNPRRREFDIADPVITRQQVAWEFINIRRVSTVLFWFAAEVQPIALHELGGAMERSQKLAIGVDPAYPRRTDVELQISNARSLKIVNPELKIHSTLEDTVADAVDHVNREWTLLGR